MTINPFVGPSRNQNAPRLVEKAANVAGANQANQGPHLHLHQGHHLHLELQVDRITPFIARIVHL